MCSNRENLFNYVWIMDYVFNLAIHLQWEQIKSSDKGFTRNSSHILVIVIICYRSGSKSALDP